MATNKCPPAVRQADALATRWVAAPRQMITMIVPESKTRPGLSARASFFRHLELISAVADIDRAVGAPFPTAVVSEETMVMVMMTMSKKTMAKSAMAKPVMAVAATVPAMPTVTSSEGLTGDGQRSSGQCQRGDGGGKDRLGLRHGRLLSWGRARVALR